jgi:hypothetical protein
MNHDYDESTISAIEQEYNDGEYSDLDADPDAEARRRSREEQEKLDKDRRRARASRRLAEAAFTPAGLNLGDGRTIADVDREMEDARKDCNRHQWLHYGPLSVAIVAMRPERYRDIIDAWRAKDMKRYERLLRDRGLVR